MSMTPEPNIREIGATLTREVRILGERVKSLDVALSRGRHIVTVVIITLAFDLALSVGLFYVAKRTNDVATRNSATLVAQCRSSNEVRAQTLAMFEGLRVVFPKQPTDPVPDQLDAIVDLARKTFVQRAC